MQADTFPQQDKKMRLQGAEGLLEAWAQHPPQNVKEHAGVALICHPNPLQGGTMDNKVVHTLARTFNALGLRTLRFNFRGVGESEGTHDHGSGEAEDVLCLARWLREVLPNDPICLAGFSFGAYVSARVANRCGAVQLISIAPPVNLCDFSALDMPRCPWLIIQGDEDEVVPYDAVNTWLGERQAAAQLITLHGAGHFFHRRLHDVQAAVRDNINLGLFAMKSV